MQTSASRKYTCSSQIPTAGGIGLYVNANKTEFMCFKQEGAIFTQSAKFLKLVDKFTYLDRYLIYWKSIYA